ncbi:hypothetical protein TNIN_117841 [Trichonephila inaurata madagascariensis]|uniref:Uncharacterized protein n=1 Tax=Trichonephila inaurata madagascariensis TaxID=2747483 RepID=A0A8X6WMZ5_9ARAC|nr:hypothetical protein TNIN_117841 [Trichonephila inaurata madagascariensis]
MVLVGAFALRPSRQGAHRRFFPDVKATVYAEQLTPFGCSGLCANFGARPPLPGGPNSPPGWCEFPTPKPEWTVRTILHSPAQSMGEKIVSPFYSNRQNPPPAKREGGRHPFRPSSPLKRLGGHLVWFQEPTANLSQPLRGFFRPVPTRRTGTLNVQDGKGV